MYPDWAAENSEIIFFLFCDVALACDDKQTEAHLVGLKVFLQRFPIKFKESSLECLKGVVYHISSFVNNMDFIFRNGFCVIIAGTV